MQIIYIDGQCLKNYQLKGFKWKKICQNWMESLYKIMMKIVTTSILQGYILEIDV